MKTIVEKMKIVLIKIPTKYKIAIRKVTYVKINETLFHEKVITDKIRHTYSG